MLYILLLGISAFSYATEDVAVIITNYHYDQWGRPAGRTVEMRPGVYYNPSFSPYYQDPYYQNPYYYPRSLPGADPDRFEELFEKNSRW